MLTAPGSFNGRVIAGALRAKVFTQIFAMAIVIVFAVGLIVTLLVAHQVSQGKSVVAGEEIDTGERAAPRHKTCGKRAGDNPANRASRSGRIGLGYKGVAAVGGNVDGCRSHEARNTRFPLS